ncbi:transforming growth factor-beta-induced protein ig-h3 [Biomphalaria glabrata]|nr:transforming growth factor-beta-induced protein ig-h3 [Biomphalaria glabrata]
MLWLRLIVIFTFVSLSSAQTTPGPQLVDALKAEGNFGIFVDLLQASGYLDKLNASTHFTVFAPTDAAFGKLPAGTVDSLKADANKLADVIGYHVILNSAFNLNNNQDKVLTSANNHSIRINTYSVVHTQTAEGVNITKKNVRVLHGILHEINGVLSPPAGNIIELGSNRSDILTFESLVAQANLTTFFTNDHSTTIFVPNNDAFKKVSQPVLDYLSSHPSDLADVLKYHVIKQYSLYSIGMAHSLSLPSGDQHKDYLMILQESNGDLKVNSAKILEKDISSVNGVVHIIDTVLIPPRVTVAIEDQGVIVG